MGSVAFTGARLLVDGYDINADFTELLLNYGSESLDATTFGQTTRIMEGGLRTADLTGKGYVNLGTCTSDALLFNQMGGAAILASIWPQAITVNATSTAANYAGHGFGMTAVDLTYTQGGQVGALLAFDLDLKAASDLVRIVALADYTTVNTTSGVTNTTPFTYFFATTCEQLYAGMHVTAITTSSGKISAILQAASSSGFATTTTRFTFTAMTCKAGQYLTPVLPSALSTDQPYWRAQITSCGSPQNALIWLGQAQRII